MSYATGENKTQPQNYALQIGSGSTFQNDYRTLASPSTIQNTLLAGGQLSYNSLSSTASLLTSESEGSSVNIFGALSLFSTTNIFA